MTQRLATSLAAVVAVVFSLIGPVAGLAQQPSPRLAVARGGQQAARGIEKKDIRFAILYNEGEVAPEQLARLSKALADPAARERIYAFAKMTKADAARQAPGAAAGAAADVAFLSAQFPESPTSCPEPRCFVLVPGVCLCGLPRSFAVSARTMAAGASRPTVVIVTGNSLEQKLASPEAWEQNRAWFDQQVWPHLPAAPSASFIVIRCSSTGKCRFAPELNQPNQ